MPQANIDVPIIFFSHHKCGTMWISEILRTICRDTGHEHAFYVTPKDFHHDLLGHMKHQGIQVATYSDPSPEFVFNQTNFRGLHIVRDPRDILISGYFSHRNSHVTKGWKELVGHREKLQSLTYEEGLIEELTFSDRFFKSLRGWQSDDSRITEIKFEELILNEYGVLLDAFDFVGLMQPIKTMTNLQRFRDDSRLYLRSALRKIGFGAFLPRNKPTMEHVVRIISRNSFTVKSGGRKRGVVDNSSHFRSGQAGQWKQHFSPEIAREFARRHQDILEKYGYENSTAWVDTINGVSAV